MVSAGEGDVLVPDPVARHPALLLHEREVGRLVDGQVLTRRLANREASVPPLTARVPVGVVGRIEQLSGSCAQLR